MATPVSRPNASKVGAGPSPRELQQLWEKLGKASASHAIDEESPLQSPASNRSWSSSRRQSGSVWVGGNDVAQDARCKLRAADEARWRKTVANTIDGSQDLSISTLRTDTLSVPANGFANGHFARAHRSPDPVRYPDDFIKYMLEGSPQSAAIGLSPASQHHDSTSSRPQEVPLNEMVSTPLSPLIFNDVFLDDSSSLSPFTEDTISPTEAPTSAATMYTVETLRTPPGAGARKRAIVCDSASEASAQKRRTVTLPDVRGDNLSDVKIDAPHMAVSSGGDDRSLLQDETFVERTPIQTAMLQVYPDEALPRLSSFRPIETTKTQTRSDGSSQRLARTLTAPVETAGLGVLDEPAWMRPMHLVDTGGRSIYKNAHVDGRIRHALCLWCFRTRGDFRKVHKHGYESCGRMEMLDSHYWEDDIWPEDSPDSSTSSDC